MPHWLSALFGPSMATHVIEDVGSFRVPKAWTVRAAESYGTCTTQAFYRKQRWWLGAGEDPLEAQASVILAGPQVSDNRLEGMLEGAMQREFGHLQRHCRRFDEFGNIKTRTRTTWISEGNYQVGSKHDPERVLFLRSIDPKRRAALVMRVYERRIAHKALRRIENLFFDSVRIDGMVLDDAPESPPAENRGVVFTPINMDKVAFNVENQRVLVLDQLRPWRIYTLQQPLRTVDGRECAAGLAFRFEEARVNLTARTARIHGLGPDDEKLVFDSRNDEHKAWFVFTGEEWRERHVQAVWPLPETDRPFDAMRLPPGNEHAAAIMAGLVSEGSRTATLDDAHVLRHAALRVAATHPSEARHLADRSLDLYHAWMSQATSGGEGTAMQSQVRNELDQLHEMLGTRPAVNRQQFTN